MSSCHNCSQSHAPFEGSGEKLSGSQAKLLREPEEAAAVEFVFKYGLALAAMGLIDAAKNTSEWETDQASCRERIQLTAVGIARVIVPLCLSLPSKLPKRKAKLAAVA